MESSENERTMDDLRTLLWTICFVLGLFFFIGFFIYCIIKCDENKKKKGIHMKTKTIRVTGPKTIRVTGPAIIHIKQCKFDGLV